MPPQDHTKFIVSTITLIVLVCIGCGTFLFVKGYQSGELLIGIASAGAGALGGMVAMRRFGGADTKPPVDTPPAPDRTGV